MRDWLLRRFVELGGITVGIAVGWLLALVTDQAYISLHTIIIGKVIPVGAFLAGALAASGFIIIALRVHRLPSASLYRSVLVNAVVVWFAIHYFQYRAASLDGILVRNFVSFTDYLTVSVASTQYFSVKSAIKAAVTGNSGSPIAWIAWIVEAYQLSAFAFGGVCAYFILESEQKCQYCPRYLACVLNRTKTFGDAGEFAAYCHCLRNMAPPSDEYVQCVRAIVQLPEDADDRFALELRVLQCPSCRYSVILETPKTKNDKRWLEVQRLGRSLSLGTDSAAIIDALRQRPFESEADATARLMAG